MVCPETYSEMSSSSALACRLFEEGYDIVPISPSGEIMELRSSTSEEISKEWRMVEKTLGACDVGIVPRDLIAIEFWAQTSLTTAGGVRPMILLTPSGNTLAVYKATGVQLNAASTGEENGCAVRGRDFVLLCSSAIHIVACRNLPGLDPRFHGKVTARRIEIIKRSGVILHKRMESLPLLFEHDIVWESRDIVHFGRKRETGREFSSLEACHLPVLIVERVTSQLGPHWKAEIESSNGTSPWKMELAGGEISYYFGCTANVRLESASSTKDPDASSRSMDIGQGDMITAISDVSMLIGCAGALKDMKHVFLRFKKEESDQRGRGLSRSSYV